MQDALGVSVAEYIYIAVVILIIIANITKSMLLPARLLHYLLYVVGMIR